MESLHESTRRYRFVIVPGLGSIDPAVAQKLSNLLEAGLIFCWNPVQDFLARQSFLFTKECFFITSVLPFYHLGIYGQDNLLTTLSFLLAMDIRRRISIFTNPFLTSTTFGRAP